jgi:hypothetical protein
MNRYFLILILVLSNFIVGTQGADSPNAISMISVNTTKSEPNDTNDTNSTDLMNVAEVEGPNSPEGYIGGDAFNLQFSTIFKDYVNSSGYVNYSKLRRHRNVLNNMLGRLANLEPEVFITWSRNEKIAFWINTYNVCTLKGMAERIKTDTDSTKIMGRYFSSLFSVVVQRYIQGQGTLKDTDKNELVTVIIQGDKYVQNFIPDWNGNFKRALDKDLSSLLAESDGLFGSAAGSGKMLTTVGFDYGKNPDGSSKTIPPTLAKPTALNK